MIDISVGGQIFTLADEEVKALETDMVSIFDWVENAIMNKARQMVDKVITDHTDKQAKKLTTAQKYTLVRTIALEKAANRRIPE